MRNLHEAKNMALKAEFMMQDRGRYEPVRRNFSGENSRAPNDYEVSVPEVQPLKDWYREDKAVEKQKVVETKETPKTTNQYTWLARIKCFKCNQPGHRSSDCPLRKAVHLVEREEEKEDEVYCELDGDEKEDSEDDIEGRSYVVRKLMLTHKQEDNTQRHQLFKTRCTINNKLVQLIIDIGSFENIIDREVMRKLKLPVEKHPHPYTIGWIKATQKIEVNEHCKVPFSIGKYRDEVYCDVVEMDACHLLFRRP